MYPKVSKGQLLKNLTTQLFCILQFEHVLAWLRKSGRVQSIEESEYVLRVALLG